jgi:hypothetical protein
MVKYFAMSDKNTCWPAPTRWSLKEAKETLLKQAELAAAERLMQQPQLDVVELPKRVLGALVIEESMRPRHWRLDDAVERDETRNQHLSVIGCNSEVSALREFIAV